MENHLLTLILQSPQPKSMVASVASIMDGVEFSTEETRVIFNTLTNFFLTNDQLSVAEVGRLLPEKFTPAFDMHFLASVPQFQSDEMFEHEIEKTAKTVKQFIIKNQLQALSEKMKKEETEGNEEELQKLRMEFNALAANFK